MKYSNPCSHPGCNREATLHCRRTTTFKVPSPDTGKPVVLRAAANCTICANHYSQHKEHYEIRRVFKSRRPKIEDLSAKVEVDQHEAF